MIVLATPAGLPPICDLHDASARAAGGEDGKFSPTWFVLDESRPLAVFSAIWTEWTSVWKEKEGMVTADVYGFLTTEPNAGRRAGPP